MKNNSVKKKAISCPEILNEPTQYLKPVTFSRGMRVELGDYAILFISGTASVDKYGKTVHKRDFLAQTKRTFKNLTALLRSERANWKDVVKTTIYLKDMRNYDIFNRFRNQFYKRQRISTLPASTCIEANLCRPDLLIEIEAIAIVKRNGRGKKFK